MKTAITDCRKCQRNVIRVVYLGLKAKCYH